MLIPSDKELDRLSREAAEQYEPDESISSWEKLEARLDTELGKPTVPSARRFGRGPIGYTAIILLITGASYFLLKQDSKMHSITLNSKTNNESITKKAAKTDATQNDNKSQQSDIVTSNAGENAPESSDPIPSQKTVDAKTGNIGSTNQDATASKPAVNSVDKNDKIKPSQNKEIAVVGNTSTETKDPTHSKTSGGTNKPESLHAGTGLGIAAVTGSTVHRHTKNPRTLVQKGGKTNADLNLSTSATVAGLTVAGAKTTGSTLNQRIDQTEKEPGVAILPDLETISNHPPIISGSLRVDPLSAKGLVSSLSGPISNKSSGKSRSLHLNKPLTVGIMVAPDITMVGGSAPDHMSGNIGITLGYQITNKLSVNTGFISTKKFYSAKGTDFHSQVPTPHFDFLRGDCNMYEIPVTIRYDFDAGDGTNFFVNGGLSSYLMTHQSYIYYKNYYGPGGSWSNASAPYPIDSNSNYLFSVINLSAGIEHRIGKNLSLQGELFVKIPLTGMGVGNLNLSSYGVSFSLRYSPTLGKSRH